MLTAGRGEDVVKVVNVEERRASISSKGRSELDVQVDQLDSLIGEDPGRWKACKPSPASSDTAEEALSPELPMVSGATMLCRSVLVVNQRAPRAPKLPSHSGRNPD